MKTPLFALTVLACVILTPGKARAQGSAEQLTAAEVTQIIAQAATHATFSNPSAIIAVTDREGFVLGVWDMQGSIPSPLPSFNLDDPAVLRIYGLFAGAITRAGTAAFLSSDQEAFTSRTAGYIIQQHFPPGVANTSPGPLVGVGFSNLFFSDINRLKQIANPLAPATPFDPPDLRASSTPGDTRRISPGVRGATILPGSLTDSPGGVPLYKNGHLVGGIGVTGDGTPTNLATAAAIFLNETNPYSTPGFVATVLSDADEQVALAGQRGFRPSWGIVATNVLINGIRIPYVWQAVRDIVDAAGSVPLGSLPGRIVDGFPIQSPPPPFPYPVTQLGGVTGEVRGPAVFDSAANPSGAIHFIDDPISTVPGRQLIGGASRLTAAEVALIIAKAAQRAAITRAGIRLPLGTSAKVFIAVVNNPDKDLEAPAVLGTFRVGEATMFSWDVAVQKARTALFFSNSQFAMSTRAVGFLSQSNFPPGIDGMPFGPLFGFQEAVSLKRRPVTGTFPGNPNLPNGITIFPGGFPLYRNGVVVGAIGVSGDGVDQDDIIAASGCADFLAYQTIRADTYAYGGARLPYAKFPRDPVIAVDAAIAPDIVPAAPDWTAPSVARVLPGSLNDLNGDGISDLVFQNTATGQVYAWFLDGTGASIDLGTSRGIKSTGYLYDGSLLGWQLAGMADVNGDGIVDLIFQNTATGQIYAFFLDGSGTAINLATGSGIKGSDYLYGGTLLGWRLAGTADVNGDGIPDLVFQNTATGQLYAWMLDGSGASISFGLGRGIKGTGYLYGGSLIGWQLTGIADVNGDGIPDLVFQNIATGQVYAWMLDGTGASIDFTTQSGIKSTGYLYGGSLPGWRLAGISDVNGDGIPDLLFQNTSSGQVYAWFLDGTGASINFSTGSGIKSTGYLYGGSLPGWQLH